MDVLAAKLRASFWTKPRNESLRAAAEKTRYLDKKLTLISGTERREEEDVGKILDSGMPKSRPTAQVSGKKPN
jgi:hypothetical protein